MSGPSFAFLHVASTAPTLAALRGALQGLGLGPSSRRIGDSDLIGLQGPSTVGPLYVGVGPTTRHARN